MLTRTEIQLRSSGKPRSALLLRHMQQTGLTRREIVQRTGFSTALVNRWFQTNPTATYSQPTFAALRHLGCPTFLTDSAS